MQVLNNSNELQQVAGGAGFFSGPAHNSAVISGRNWGAAGLILGAAGVFLYSSISTYFRGESAKRR
ncbi:hypothetical protein H8K32_14220 [Undibacterium jejuense]|uniref:Uncharacterized protein n=1 Tax=Undibacterium jejuense TaxID=1344949 RepID=A0A923HGE6_9BURK|nr:hypothetical protein [Undibacterium jejuense]MBC3863259.1 hypothetical protein [Undibacterium jejuense]